MKVACSDYQLKLWKPDLAIYIHAAKQMSFKPSECAVIEDSPAGIQAAVSGGFDTPNNTKEKESNLTYFSHMDELYGLLF